MHYANFDWVKGHLYYAYLNLLLVQSRYMSCIIQPGRHYANFDWVKGHLHNGHLNALCKIVIELAMNYANMIWFNGTCHALFNWVCIMQI